MSSDVESEIETLCKQAEVIIGQLSGTVDNLEVIQSAGFADLRSRKTAVMDKLSIERANIKEIAEAATNHQYIANWSTLEGVQKILSELIE